jgi:CRISPR-associated endonuclease Csy4
MDHFLDLELRPDPEYPATVLMNALFGRLHRALALRAQGDIGVSFPKHDQAPPLGDVLRLHGTHAALEELMATGWLEPLRAHVFDPLIRPAPRNCGHRVVQRVQAKSSAQRLRRRHAARHALSDEEAAQAVPDGAEERLDLPFLQISSTTTGQRFRLFVRHGEILAERRPGRFSSYGLSARATVPWF